MSQNAASHQGLFCLLTQISSKNEIKNEKYSWCPLKLKWNHLNDKDGKVQFSHYGWRKSCFMLLVCFRWCRTEWYTATTRGSGKSTNNKKTKDYGETPLSPTDSALSRTDLSPLTNGIWEIHAEYTCFLHLKLKAKICRIPYCKAFNVVIVRSRENGWNPALKLTAITSYRENSNRSITFERSGINTWSCLTGLS